jgi:isopentenyl-diphosphate delta-isomerase
MIENINIVNEQGERIGSVEKIEAHVNGVLHEAFSIFVFNSNEELLLQRRNIEKYHSGGLWTNTCCSHPRVGEDINKATHRRLFEEMGFDCELKEMFSFLYKAEKLANNLIEHEFDHVFVGYVENVNILPDENEVCEYAWIKISELKKDIVMNPQKYTEWFKIIMGSQEFNSIVK